MSKDLKKQLDYLEDIDQLELQENTEDFAEFEKYEAAYKNLKEQDAPDLWARIEAGIDKDSKTELNQKEIDITIETDVKPEVDIIEETDEVKEGNIEASLMKQTQEKSKKESNIVSINQRKKYVAAFSTMAAAILLCLVILPVVMDGTSQSDTSATVENSTSSGADKEVNSKESADFDNIDSEETYELSQEENACLEDAETSNSAYEAALPKEKSEGEEVELLEVEDVLEEDLEKIAFSSLSKISKKKIKELVENYKECTFYADEEGKVYLLDQEVMYEVKGVYQK
ncbi:MAG: hypothetical protein IJA36_09405 [Lachnospiraceae bacterium]|nr:hypothetical protein [Lachnospiraceae bacterium]